MMDQVIKINGEEFARSRFRFVIDYLEERINDLMAYPDFNNLDPELKKFKNKLFKELAIIGPKGYHAEMIKRNLQEARRGGKLL